MKNLVINSFLLIKIVISKMLTTNKKKNEKKLLKILEKLPKINDFNWKRIKEEYYEERVYSRFFYTSK